MCRKAFQLQISSRGTLAEKRYLKLCYLYVPVYCGIFLNLCILKANHHSKRPDREADHSPPTTADMKNA
jgi:hypothetical protein